jgi:mannose-6-phosphate isomerase-like protein (cupin superfamily)
MPPKRIVTSENAKGMAVISSSEDVDQLLSSKETVALKVIDLWATDTAPADLDAKNPLSQEIGLAPPHGGTIFRFCDFYPESKYRKNLQKADVDTAWKVMTSGDTSQVTTQFAHARHPFMHKTQTIDYGIILFGEIYLVLDDAEILLKPGDVVIQKGTNHFWSNRSNDICRIAFVLVDANPRAKTIGPD